MASIKEIAKAAQVSCSTVSRALNHKKGVSTEVRDKIIKIAEDLSYFPHSGARSLVQNRAGVIGVIIPRTSEFAFQSPFYNHVLLGLSEMAGRHDYNLMLIINDSRSYTSFYYRHQVDGVIVVGNRINDERTIELAEKNVPAVIVPGFPEGEYQNLATVNSENFKSTHRAVSYLIGLGHRKIAFVLGSMSSKYSFERLEAYQKAFREHDLDYDPAYVAESDFTKTDAYRLMGELLDLDQPPTAVICINDTLTPGVLQQIFSRGLKIPQQISVVAIGCSDLLDLVLPPLTTVRVPAEAIGQTMARVLIQLIETGHCNKRHTVIPTDFIIRESTGPAIGQGG
ncbi:MAG: LacI family transcriptional regulator [Desulfarculaceae bacterium]|nr:LacI family transcriptional regulator [Desulfarculaceae bacterium]MCF8072886.1 LacI family transcriptional regulator [Desulfarculaceae bacterium]MCF8101054.1 LacI family transcriptional regulator [Desulfarculaceae bacterium]MCF8115559.1 LacI family transcriptional regulator [Desulfarculaceae bacterium]